MNDWKDYLDDRVISYELGFPVIKSKDQFDVVPIGCIICESLYRTADDEVAHLKFGCCDACANTWAYVNPEWIKGWRPSKQQVIDELARRIALPKSELTFK